MRKLSLSIFLFLVLVSSVLGAPGVPIPVVNFSFELPGTEKIKGWNGEGVAGTPAVDIPGWASDTVVVDSGVETGYTPTDGLWTAFLMNSDPAVWQLTGYTIAAGDIFQLKLDSRITYAATDLQAVLYYDQDGTRVPLATQEFAIAAAMQEFTLICAAADVPASVGNKLGIEFKNVSTGSDNWAGIDNVRLEVFDKDPRLIASGPEPADGTIGVQLSLLRWVAGQEAGQHNLYFGTDPNLTETNLLSGPLAVAVNWYFSSTPWAPGQRFYWRVDEIEKDGVTIHPGDTWTFMMQDVTAYYPQPAHRATDVPLAPTLTWMRGQGAMEHQLFFSDDFDTVSQATADANQGTFDLDDETFTPGTLEPLRTYWWRVDESLAGDAVTPGPVWNFTTCQPLDDFESYNDEENQGTRIYETWIDGYADGSSGSIVGNVDPPFAEQTIVRSGLQSMPLDYNNVDPPFFSEAWREFSPAADWTVGDVNALVLSIQGRLTNGVVPLYIALEDSSQNVDTVVYPDPNVVTAAAWIAWKIPLSDFAGVNLARVKKMYIGLGDKANPVEGGTGRLYIDDIALTKPAPAIEP
jgi:hypothetical protein